MDPSPYRPWVVTLAGLGALLVAVLAVATNIATGLPPGWGWLRNGAIMWTAVGVLTAATVTTAVAGTRLSLPPPSAVVSNLAPRNPYFTGRDDHLARLRRYAFRAATGVAVLRGLGGSGKSQAALEFAYGGQDRKRYGVIWWIRAESPITIAEDLAALAPALGLPVHDDRARTIADVHRALRDRRWLLVLDNAADPAEVRRWIVPGVGHTLITTRLRTFEALGVVLDVDTFSRPESLAYLRTRTGHDDPYAAEMLAHELGDLPLALSQAGASIASGGLAVADYLARFRARREAAVRLTADLADYPASVATTWLVQFEELGALHAEARDLLRYCAHLDVDDIDLSAVSGGLRTRPSGETVDALVVGALVTRLGPDRLRMHRLVAEVTRHELGVSARHAAAVVVRMLHRLFPDRPWEPGTWDDCGRLAAHVLSSTGHPGARIREAGSMLNWLAIYLEYRGDYRLARSVSLRALGITEDCYGADHPEVATAVLNLASLDRRLGRISEGITFLERELETFDRGDDRMETAGLLMALGGLYEAAGRYGDAVGTLRRALLMTERVYPAGHPAVADVVVALASAESAEHPEWALQTIGRVAELTTTDDPDTAARLAVHGRILARLGDLPAAAKLLREAHEINERILGSGHPDTQASRQALLD